MPSSSPLDRLFADIRHSHANGRLGQAYLIVGPPRGAGLALAERILQLLFCQEGDPPCGECSGCKRAVAHTHPDIVWVEPASKSRQITIDDHIRPLNSFIGRTPFENGWKAGVILAADCMNANSQNAFLKTLEEPPPKNLLLLVTDRPDALLDTIRSRCRKLDLACAGEHAAAPWFEALMEVLAALPPRTTLDAIALGDRLAGLLEKVREEIEAQEDDDSQEAAGGPAPEPESGGDKKVREARIRAQVIEARSAMFQVILEWHRDLLLCVLGMEDGALHFPAHAGVLRAQARQLDQAAALQRIQSIEEALRRLDRNLREPIVFTAMLLAALPAAAVPPK